MIQPVNNALLPAEVRAGGAKERELYGTAVAFERQLVAQLAQQLEKTLDAASAGGDDEEGSGAATQSYRQALPGMLADSVTAAGGLGLAPVLYRSLKGEGR
jgi:Rod binding domain-containing protein